MKNEKTDSASLKKKDGGSRQAKGCCLLFVSILIACIIFVITGIAGIIIADTIQLRGEDFSFSQRVQRYKVACLFLWYDFMDAVARRSPSGTHAVSCPAEPPESGTEQEP